jgi:aryl-alcohol dehydrogenase-like predicted oxidoreductase
MLQLAALNGIDVLDTAISYGESESCLGEVGVEQFKVVSKLPSVPHDCADITAWVEQQVVSSLTRLNIAELYGLLLHRSDQILSENGKLLYKAMQGLKDRGLVRKIGVSIYSPCELEEIARLVNLDLLQAPFSIVDCRLHTSGWMHRLKNKGTEIHTRSSFLQGLLLMPKAAIPKKFATWFDLWGRWHKWLESRGVSAVQACLSFPLSFPAIDRVVVGVDSLGQLEQIIQVASGAPLCDLPDMHCDAEALINPAFWPTLK